VDKTSFSSYELKNIAHLLEAIDNSGNVGKVIIPYIRRKFDDSEEIIGLIRREDGYWRFFPGIYEKVEEGE
jgi:hypothetical protein